MNGFKITVNLVEFFNDHRRLCRMFVNLNRMETINDLQEHIAKTFNLSNFYLMAEKQYLPGTESIQVLNVNDCISVAPLSNQSALKAIVATEENRNSSSENEAIENGKNKRKKKNKNKEKEYPNKKLKNSFTPSNECLWGSTPVETNLIEQLDNDENITKKMSKKNKTLKRTNLATKIDDEIDEQTHNSVKDKVEYFEKHNDLINLNQCEENESNISPETINISDIMKNHKLFVKPNDSLKLISTKLPQQQNIIKNIVVSTSKESSGFQFPEHVMENDKDPIQKDTKVTILQDIAIPQDIIEINNDNVEIMETESPTESQSISSNIQENITKRKRVRTRKRKLKNFQPEEKTNIQTNFNFKINLPKPSPSIHIKFDDDGNMKNLKNVENQSEKNDESDQVIIVDLDRKVLENDEVEYVPNENEIIEKGKNDFQIGDDSVIKTETELLELVPETIEKYPLLQEQSLQEGNVIAFKLLKLANSLIPEMTNYIIGNIIGINNDGKDVVINVIDGLEEAKTAAESLCEGDELIDVTETMRKYERRHLLGARLIAKNIT